MQLRERLVCGALCLLLLTALQGTGAAETEEQFWRVQDGRIIFHFYEDLLSSYGIELTNIEETGDNPDQPIQMKIDPPWCAVSGDRVGRAGQLDLTLLESGHTAGRSFDITEESDFTFRVKQGVLDPSGLIKGNIRLDGGLTFVVGDSEWEMRDFVFEYFHEPDGLVPGDPNPHAFRIRNAPKESLFLMDANRPMTVFMGAYNMMILGYNDLVIRDEWAKAMGRPGMAGLMLGTAEVQAMAVPLKPGAVNDVTFEPDFLSDRADTLDVLLGFLFGMVEVGREGTYPNGVAALSFATTACNKGNVDVPWEAPMEENHPGITMEIFRETDTGMYTKFEMIGYSDMKHGFFALSNSDCDPCQHPSDGTFLGVGCSDTYGSGNNADRTWLGPRHEWNPYLGTWECTGSHFSGGEPDCIRRHGSSGHGPLDHRLFARDQDLSNPNATYYYESMYVVQNDMFRMNSIGSKEVIMSWDGFEWDFTDNGPLIEGPAVLRWDADMHTWAQVGSDDGQVILSSKATDLGGGAYHYEYALFNFDSHRKIRSITIPRNLASDIANVEFHDGDLDDGNDWTAFWTDEVVTYETVTFEEDSLGNALMFDWLFNFRFDADGPPQTVDAKLGIFRPGDPTEIWVETIAPGTVSSVEEGYLDARIVRLYPSRPNPLSLPTTVRFELAESMPVKLDVFDASGRRVRTLVDGLVSPGFHSLVWDGSGSDGRRVSSGVYFYFLRAGKETAKQSVVVVQ